MAEDPPAVGTQRGPYRNFFVLRRTLSQQQSCDVRAGNEQNERDCTLQDQEQITRIRENIHVFQEQRPDADVPTFIGFRRLLRELRCNGVTAACAAATEVPFSIFLTRPGLERDFAVPLGTFETESSSPRS